MGIGAQERATRKAEGLSAVTDNGNPLHAKYESDWWLIGLPLNWVWTEDPECASFHASPQLGLLQISAARKPIGEVTPEDVYEFATDSSAPKSTIRPISSINWSGFYSEYQGSGLLWRQWWVCGSAVLVYITYSVPNNRQGIEIDEVIAIVDSLRIKR